MIVVATSGKGWRVPNKRPSPGHGETQPVPAQLRATPYHFTVGQPRRTSRRAVASHRRPASYDGRRRTGGKGTRCYRWRLLRPLAVLPCRLVRYTARARAGAGHGGRSGFSLALPCTGRRPAHRRVNRTQPAPAPAPLRALLVPWSRSPLEPPSRTLHAPLIAPSYPRAMLWM